MAAGRAPAKAKADALAFEGAGCNAGVGGEVGETGDRGYIAAPVRSSDYLL